MPHIRKVVRDEIATALKGQTSAGERVYTQMPPHAIEDRHLPCIVVQSGSDSVDNEPLNRKRGHRQRRRLQIDVIAACGSSDWESLSDALDNLTVEIEETMAAQEAFGGSQYGHILSGTSGETSDPDDGGKPRGVQASRYTVEILTMPDDPKAPAKL